MVYPALLTLMRLPRLPVVDWTEAPADLNGLVRFAERRNLVSARVPSHFKSSLPKALFLSKIQPRRCGDKGPPSAEELMDPCSHTSTVPYVSMKWCLVVFNLVQVTLIIEPSATFQTATIGFVISVCLSAYPHGQTRLPLDWFSRNLIFLVFFETVEKFRDLLNSEKKCGNEMPTRCNRWFLLQVLLLAQHVSGTIMPIIRNSRVLYRWSLPVVFGALVFKLSVWCGAEGYVSGLRAAASWVTARVFPDVIAYLFQPLLLQFKMIYTRLYRRILITPPLSGMRPILSEPKQFTNSCRTLKS